jgi:hypothetical protein
LRKEFVGALFDGALRVLAAGFFAPFRPETFAFAIELPPFHARHPPHDATISA